MPTAREHLTSAVVNDKLYVIGGRSAGMSANVNFNEAYDPKTDSWSSLEPMPSKRGGLASSAINETIYVFGGEEPSGTFDNNEIYDITTNKWDKGLAMPTARHGLVAVANDDKIYVIGGGPNPGGSRSSANEIFLAR
jgi:N-acetylneuraminic acid mutarotase